jgi:hypothetical protein
MATDLHPAQLGKLLDQWREKASDLRRYGAAASAAAVEACAGDLEAWLDAWADVLLTPKEAAAETGLRPETIAKKIASGELPNAGRKHRPRVRRRDLYTPRTAAMKVELPTPVEQLLDEVINNCE